MDFIKTKIDGVVIVEPKVFGDHPGFLYGELLQTGV